MAIVRQVLLAAVLALALSSAHAETACQWTKAAVCRLRSGNMMPELRAAINAKIGRNDICQNHATESGCARGAPDNCKAFELKSLADDETQVICADAGAQFESLEDYKTAVEAAPAFQELCFTADGYVTWACMRDLALLSKFLGCSECNSDVLTLEKMHQTCSAAQDLRSCTGSASDAAKTFALNGVASAELPKEAVPRPAAEKVVRTLATGGYYSPPPPAVVVSPPPPPLQTNENSLGPSGSPLSAASPISVGLSLLGALFFGAVMLAF